MNDISIFLKLIKKYGIVYFLLLSGLIVLKISSCIIPDNNIMKNVYESRNLILDEGRYPLHFISDPEQWWIYAQYRLDSVTEYSILNTVIMNANEQPMYQAIANKSYLDPEPEHVVQALEGDYTQKVNRSQYWMGETVFLRFAYNFMNVAELRRLMSIVFIFTLSLLEITLYKRLGAVPALAVAFSMGVTNFWVVQFSPFFFTTVFMAFVFSIAILYRFKENKIAMSFFVFGVLTAFFDWMSTPLLTYSFPMLIVVFLMIQGETKYRDEIVIFIKGTFAWIIGFALTIVSKWPIASIVLRENVFKIGLSRIKAGSSNSLNGDPTDFWEVAKLSLQKNLGALQTCRDPMPEGKEVLLCVILYIFLLVLAYKFKKNTVNVIGLVLVALVGISPYVWDVVLKGHSNVHYWFVYRNQCVSIVALICILLFIIDFERVRKKVISVFVKEKKL